MGLRRILASIAAALVVYTGSLEAADKKKITANELTQPSYELPQPDKERLDYQMYQRIREEALAHSHVMEYASGLMDGIGARLTGSPNLKRASEWTRDQFTAMGCSNAHLEDWGEFGMGWQQLNTWVRMTSPDTAVFIAQAAPWSASTNGFECSGNLGKYQGRKRFRQIQRQASGKDCLPGRDAGSEAGGQAIIHQAR